MSRTAMASVRLLLLTLLGAGLHPRPAMAQDSLVVSAEWLAARLAAPDLVVVEVAPSAERYREGHIPGARFISLGAIVTERDGIPNELAEVPALTATLEQAGISSTSRIVVYGDPLSAARLFFTLDYLGLGDRTSILDGGLVAWKRHGGTVTPEMPVVRAGHLTVALRPEVLVTGEWVRQHLSDSTVALIDARPPAEWSGQVPGAGITRPGHIPGAASFFWRLSLTPPEPALLKDRAVLSKLLARTGAGPGRTVVTYCRTGVQASWLYFVARTLGYSPRLYDGSYLEWSRMAEYPVEP